MILTIAIPTYNGAAHLERLLESIFSQAFPKDEVEVILVDNKSEDETISICKNFQDVTIFLNDENLGADRNFAKCMELASGDYVWMIGDDDYIIDNSICAVLEKIDKYCPTAIFMNYSIFDSAKQRFIRDKLVDFSTNKEILSQDDFFLETKNAANFLSCMVHRKDLFLSVKFQKYFSTHWLQYISFLEYSGSHPGICVISEPLLVNAGNSEFGEANINGVALSVIFSLYDCIELVPSSKLDNKIKLVLLEHIRTVFPRKIITSVVRGLVIDANVRSAVKKRSGSNLKYYFIILPCLYIPRYLLCILHSCYRRSFVKSIFWKYWFK